MMMMMMMIHSLSTPWTQCRNCWWRVGVRPPVNVFNLIVVPVYLSWGQVYLNVCKIMVLITIWRVVSHVHSTPDPRSSFRLIPTLTEQLCVTVFYNYHFNS